MTIIILAFFMKIQTVKIFAFYFETRALSIHNKITVFVYCLFS